MNPITWMTSFKGRIGRRGFVAGLVLLALVSPFSVSTILSSNPVDEFASTVRQTGFAGLAWSIALLVMVAALMTKRLHDQGRSGIYAALFYLPTAIEIARFFGGGDLLARSPELARYAYLSTFILPWVGASGLLFLVQLGLRGGQRGANRYGPDPRGT
ncbi:MAG: DUF805 domain-containing protein [Hyphomicrobiaceae bacterium]